MPKIGSLDYPTMMLSDAANVAEKVAKEFHGSVPTSGLAKALNMAEKGGAFLHKVASLKDYELLEGRGTLKVTPLGERIAFPRNPGEADRARAEAFRQIELFRRLFDRTQGRVPDEDSFEIFLQEVTGASRMDVARKAATIRRLFADGAQFAKAAAEIQPTDEEMFEVAEPWTLKTAKRGRANLIELYAGDIELRLPASSQSIDIIIGVLKMVKGQLGESGPETQEED